MQTAPNVIPSPRRPRRARPDKEIGPLMTALRSISLAQSHAEGHRAEAYAAAIAAVEAVRNLAKMDL